MGSWLDIGDVPADELARMDDDGANPLPLERWRSQRKYRRVLRDITSAEFQREYLAMWNEDPRPHEVAMFEHISERHERRKPQRSFSGSILRCGEYLDPWTRLAPDAEISFAPSLRVMGYLYNKPLVALERVSVVHDLRRLHVAIDPAIPDGSVLVICDDPYVLALADLHGPKVLMGWIKNISISHGNLSPTDGIPAVQQESPDAPQPALPTPRIEP